MREQITNYVRAGYPGLYLVTAEETRAESELKSCAQATNHGLCAWSATTGLVDTKDGRTMGGEDPMEAVTALASLPKDTVAVFRDLHLFLQDPNPVLVRTLMDALVQDKANGKCLVLVGYRRVLPLELEREFTTVELMLPGKAELGLVLDGICETAKLKKLKIDERDHVLDAVSGLTCAAAEKAFALSVVRNNAVTAINVE